MDAEAIKQKAELENLHFQEEINKMLIAQTGNVLKVSELSLMQSREAMRPHRLYNAEVYYDGGDGRFVCRLFSGSDDDDELVDPQDIVAYGETPAQACDNFDKLWIHGPEGN